MEARWSKEYHKPDILCTDPHEHHKNGYTVKKYGCHKLLPLDLPLFQGPSNATGQHLHGL